ncbi:MAG: alpha-L-fucosidase [Spirochaetaceae bacterium]
MDIPKRKHTINIKALNKWSSLKFGLFIHWGLYSIPAGIWNGKKIPRLGEQIQRHASIKREVYQNLTKDFNPVKFNAPNIVKTAIDAGMKYIVLTVKHHDGFCLFKTDTTDFNVVDLAPYKKDILKELSEACLESNIKLGIYFSNPDWNSNTAVTREPETKYAVFEEFTKDHLDLSIKQLRELLNNYGAINEVFFDMGLPTVEDSIKLSETVHKQQPDCLVSGRVMNNQGDFLTLPDNHLPENPINQGCETPCTFYHSWGYKSWIDRPNIETQLRKQIDLLCRVTSSGGNYLLNIGPKADGSILNYEKQVLSKIGEWVKINRDSIFNVNNNPFNYLTWGYATWINETLYLMVSKWPKDNKILLPEINNLPKKISFMTGGNEIKWKTHNNRILIDLFDFSPEPYVTVIKCQLDSKLVVKKNIAIEIDNKIELTRENEISQGNYNNLQYNTNIPDIEKKWSFYIKNSENFKIEIKYSLDMLEMPIVIQVGDKSLKLLLTGQSSGFLEGFSDGNEINHKKKQLKIKSISLGLLIFKEPGIKEILIKKDSQSIKQSGIWTEKDIKSPHAGPWCLNKDWTNHRKSYAKESMNGLTIQSIILRRQHET